jgi:hypothetical protein
VRGGGVFLCNRLIYSVLHVFVPGNTTPAQSIDLRYLSETIHPLIRLGVLPWPGYYLIPGGLRVGLVGNVVHERFLGHVQLNPHQRRGLHIYHFKDGRDVTTLNIQRVCNLLSQLMVIIQLIILNHIYFYHVRRDFFARSPHHPTQ